MVEEVVELVGYNVAVVMRLALDNPRRTRHLITGLHTRITESEPRGSNIGHVSSPYGCG